MKTNLHNLSLNVGGEEGNKKGRIGMDAIKKGVYQDGEKTGERRNKEMDARKGRKSLRGGKDEEGKRKRLPLTEACKERKKKIMVAQHLHLLRSFKQPPLPMTCLVFCYLHL